MIHTSKINGKEYEIGTLVDLEALNLHQAYNMDMTFVIDTDEDGIVTPIGWYFGDYDYNVTENYICNYINGGKFSGDIVKDELKEIREKQMLEDLYKERQELKEKLYYCEGNIEEFERRLVSR